MPDDGATHGTGVRDNVELRNVNQHRAQAALDRVQVPLSAGVRRLDRKAVRRKQRASEWSTWDGGAAWWTHHGYQRPLVVLDLAPDGMLRALTATPEKANTTPSSDVDLVDALVDDLVATLVDDLVATSRYDTMPTPTQAGISAITARRGIRAP